MLRGDLCDRPQRLPVEHGRGAGQDLLRGEVRSRRGGGHLRQRLLPDRGQVLLGEQGLGDGEGGQDAGHCRAVGEPLIGPGGEGLHPGGPDLGHGLRGV